MNTNPMNTTALFLPEDTFAKSLGETSRAGLGRLVKRGLARKAQQGDWPFRVPLGYLHSFKGSRTLEGSRKVIVIDKVRAPLIRHAFEMAAQENASLPAQENASLPAIRQAVTEKGLTTRSGQPLSLSALCRMLSNPFYIGTMRCGEKTFPGKHQPLVSRECFQKAQDVLETQR